MRFAHQGPDRTLKILITDTGVTSREGFDSRVTPKPLNVCGDLDVIDTSHLPKSVGEINSV